MNESVTFALQSAAHFPPAVPQQYQLLGPGPQGYDVDDLGTFGTFDATSQVIPYDINDAGLVVGVEFFSNGVSAFSYTKAGGIVDLGSTPNMGPFSLATGVNAAGQIAVMADRSGGAGGYVPARLASGVVTVFPLLPLPGYNAVPPASYYTAKINGAGHLVGAAFDSHGASLPFLSDGVAMSSLGSLGGATGGGRAINASGEVVGFSATTTTPHGDLWNPGHAFLYTAATGLVDLNNLIVGGHGAWELRTANAINARGRIVGFGLFTPGPPATSVIRAFEFSHGVVQDLGTSPNGGISVATSINDRGDIVGIAYLDASGVGNFKACIFLPCVGAIDLNYLINPTLGWNLTYATAVNNAGQIVGYGARQGVPGTRGFLLTPTY